MHIHLFEKRFKKKIKTIEDGGEKRIKAIKEHGKKLTKINVFDKKDDFDTYDCEKNSH